MGHGLIVTDCEPACWWWAGPSRVRYCFYIGSRGVPTTHKQMTRTTFFVTTPNGNIAKRTSATRTYTHAIVRGGSAMTWCGSLALAQKQLRLYGADAAIAEATTR